MFNIHKLGKKALENIATKNSELNNLILNDVDKELLSKLYLFTYFLEQSAVLNELIILQIICTKSQICLISSTKAKKYQKLKIQTSYLQKCI